MALRKRRMDSWLPLTCFGLFLIHTYDDECVTTSVLDVMWVLTGGPLKELLEFVDIFNPFWVGFYRLTLLVPKCIPAILVCSARDWSWYETLRSAHMSLNI